MSNMLKPVEVPKGVEVELRPGLIRAKGPKGELEQAIPEELEVHYDEDQRQLSVSRRNDERDTMGLHGLHRSLLANLIEGITKGFEKKLQIHGTGYNVNVKGKQLVLQVGYCHEVAFDIPEGMEVEIEQNAAQPDNPARFTIRATDKHALGQFAANVRASRPPEPYKGKGIRYADEHVRRKEGKAFAGLE